MQRPRGARSRRPAASTSPIAGLMLAKPEQASLVQPSMERNMKILLAGTASLLICGSAIAQTTIPAVATYRNDVPSSGSLDPNAVVGASCASSARVAALNAANPGSDYSKFQTTCPAMSKSINSFEYTMSRRPLLTRSGKISAPSVTFRIVI